MVEKAQEIFRKMAETCYSLEYPHISEIVGSLERDVLAADTVDDVINSVEELKISVLENLDQDNPEEYDIISEIEKTSEQIYELS